jgi:K+-transporting ATPase KdpF subunit
VLLVRELLRASLKGDAMNLDYIISGLIALALLVYLAYALLKPEKF